MSKRVMLIGLDCAAPQLLFDRWLDRLPTLRGLVARGRSGVLRSCDPPITVPAWSVMMSSRTPGELGIYGFRNRADRTYDNLSIADSRAVKAPRVWDLLSDAGRDVIVLGVPGTYPPTPVRGSLVSCFLTPDPRTSAYTFPARLKDEIESVIGEYQVDVRDFRTDAKSRLLEQIVDMTEKRFRLAGHLLDTRPWDFFAMVEMGTDRVHHGFWRYMDASHRLHEPGSRFEHAIRDYYVLVDELIGELLARADEDTAVLVVSDHGAKRMDGAIAVNEWLRREGHLFLHAEPDGPTRLTPDMIDWRRTIAWGEGGYYARVFLNVEGREPQGVLEPSRYEVVRDELKNALEALGDEDGRPIGTRVFRPEDLYGELNGVPPDLLVYFGDLNWRSAGTVGTPIHLRENDTGPDDANHAHEGLYILAAPGVVPARGEERQIVDIAPTILGLLDEPIPDGMRGLAVSTRAADRATYSEEEEALVAQRLEDLGYL
jgi:predicted AlkP superfamily phosphohydrolase/phosphomutase